MKASPPPIDLPVIGYHGITAGALLSAAFLYVPAGETLVLAGPVITTLWILEGSVAGGFAGLFAWTFAPRAPSLQRPRSFAAP